MEVIMDYHVHSSFSSDCDIDPEDVILDGIRNGVDEICFTDHIDYDYQDPSIIFEFDCEEYFERLTELKEKYKEQITVKIGVEIGMQKHILKRCSDFVNKKPYDFVIGSLHTCDKHDIYLSDFFNTRTPHEALTDYIEEIHYCVKNYDEFSVVGHIDLLKRYSQDVNSLCIDDYIDKYKEIFKILVEKNKGIEINTSGLRQDVGVQFPDVKILKAYKEMGGEIITIGSDTHQIGTLESNFDKVKGILKELGFEHIYKFEKMVPVKVKI